MVEVLAEEVDLKDKVDVIVSEWMLGSWVCYRLGASWLRETESEQESGEKTLLYLERKAK